MQVFEEPNVKAEMYKLGMRLFLGLSSFQEGFGTIGFGGVTSYFQVLLPTSHVYTFYL